MTEFVLTPFSADLTRSALQAAQNQFHRELALTPPSAPTLTHMLDWRRQNLVAAVVATWQVDVGLVAALWQVQPDNVTAHPSIKRKKTVRLAERWLAEADSEISHLRRWAAGVQEMVWSQSQLLQVMEEVEPMLAAALTLVDQMAWVATGAFTQLATLWQRWYGDQALSTAMRLMQGLLTPAAQQVQDWAQGASAAVWQQRWGHWAASELEVAVPRLAERMPTDWPRAPQETAWQPQRAAQVAAETRQQVGQRAGLLHRKAVNKMIDLCRQAVLTYGQARDALAWVQAATRTWVLAAAAEGAEGDRIQQTEEIFQLEIEEIKQMLTGEWHHRRHVATQIAERTMLPLQSSASGPALAVAGQSLQGPCVQVVDTPAALAEVGGHIVLANHTHAGWTPYFLHMTGLVVSGGHWMSHAAAVARAGALPMLIDAQTASCADFEG